MKDLSVEKVNVNGRFEYGLMPLNGSSFSDCKTFWTRALMSASVSLGRYRAHGGPAVWQ